MNQPKPTLHLLKSLAVYSAVARTGGFRAAAVQLEMDHLTVARQVRLLESELGCQLVTVHRQKLRVTASGERLLRETQGAIAQLTTALAAQAKRQVLPLRIACEPGFLGCWLLPRIRGLRDGQPQLNFVLLPASSALGQVDPDADLTISFTESVGPQDIVICRPAAIAVCSPDLSARHDGFPTIASLMNAPLIHDDSEHYWSWWFHQNGVSAQAPAPGTFLQVMDARLAVEAARDGVGIALLNTLIAKDDLHSGRLVQARPETASNETYVARAVNSARRNDARLVAGWIKRLVRSEGIGAMQ